MRTPRFYFLVFGAASLAPACGSVSSIPDAGQDPADTGDAGGQNGCDDGFSGAECEECVVFVDGDSGASENSGLSWDAPLAGVQAGIDLAESRLSEEIGTCSVWVRAGVYVPGTSRSDSFALAPKVHVYGGFAGGESRREERDVEANPSLLSGDIERNDEPGDRATLEDNAFHVVVGADDAVLDGFTVAAGVADGDAPDNDGAAIFIENASPALANLTFEQNASANAGGAVYTLGGNPTLAEVTFRENSAEVRGGALYSGDGGEVTIEEASFSDNSAGSGGGAIHNTGGATLAITNATFSDNSAEELGGAIRNADATARLTNAEFSGNVAGNAGGAMDHNQQTTTLTNATFVENAADSSGGALHVGLGALSARNVILWDNEAPEGPEVDDSVGTGEATIRSSIVEGGKPATVAQENFIDSSGEDPEFRDQNAGNFRLLASSPAIDGGEEFPGLPDEDLDGNPRIADGDSQGEALIDIGPYEFQP